MQIQRYGWIPDHPDKRDFKYTVEAPITLPSKVDLSASCPAIVDQGQLGSCTANGIAKVWEFALKKQKLKDFNPSRLFIYYNERVIEHSVSQDSGAQIRDGIKSVAKQGVCDEAIWKYNISKFKTKPSKTCYTQALNNQAILYKRIDNTRLNLLKSCLAQGFPFVFGFTVYESFESQQVADTGIVPMPKHNEQVLGGHCVYSDGYDDSNNWFDCANSWGTGWGIKGRFKMPYAYLTDPNLVDDFWMITSVE